jgi:hypothetical protein
MGGGGVHQLPPSAANQIFSLAPPQGQFSGGTEFGGPHQQQQMALSDALPAVMLAPPEDDGLLGGSAPAVSGFGASAGGTLFAGNSMPSPGSPEMTLASMQAIKNPAWWDSMMMPG